jgi:hypothetical protein
MKATSPSFFFLVDLIPLPSWHYSVPSVSLW